MRERDPGRLEADVAVVGAGPAGIAAACCAAEAGARVVVLDEALRAGGQIWRHTERAQLPRPARRWLERLDRSGARVIARATVLDVSPELTVEAHCPEALLAVAARRVILATGARERFLPFPGWTLPGVMGIGGAQALWKSGASFAGRRVVIAGSGPLLLPVAAALAAGGARLVLVAEQAPAARVRRFGVGLWRSPGKLLQAVRYRSRFASARYALGTWVRSAAGEGRVQEVTLTDGRRSWTEPCDVLCTGYGLVPSVELPGWLGCAVEAGRVVADRWQATTRPGIHAAGEATGIGGVESAVVEGEIAGLAAAGREEQAARRFGERDRHRAFQGRLEAAFALREELRSRVDADTLVCRCEDVSYGRLKPEWSARQAKLYTRAGMGPCQGRVCGPALEQLFGWTVSTARAPLVPATVSTFLTPAVSGGNPTERR